MPLPAKNILSPARRWILCAPPPLLEVLARARLAVRLHHGAGEPPQPARNRSRIADLGGAPQRRDLALQARVRLARRHGLGGRVEQIRHQTVGAFTLALEVGVVNLGDLFEALDL